ncbi:MAG TPA: trimeric intracellular cation channel family protein [Firmicutes bacterium]|nr:trimeric intracellular cation channel family protein [Bacillota bacterium]
MDLMTALDTIGIIVFAASGAINAIQKKMDIFGIFTLATVTAIGGGVIRDVVINIDLPTFFKRPQYLLFIAATVLLIIFMRGKFKWQFLFNLFDAIGLAVFTIQAGMTAISMNLNFMTFLFVSLITAVGGGIIRDVMSKEVPLVLREEVYAVASIAGAVLFWFIYPYLGITVSAYLCIAFIFILRMVCVIFHLNLPKIPLNYEDADHKAEKN